MDLDLLLSLNSVQWSYLSNDDFVPFDKELNVKIENASRKGKSEFAINGSSKIDFMKGIWINDEGEITYISRNENKKPSIKVEELKKLSTKGVPDNVINNLINQAQGLGGVKQIDKEDNLPELPQEIPTEGKGKRIPVIESSSEFQTIKTLFDKTMSGKYNYFEVCEFDNPRTRYFFNDALIRIATENKKSVSETVKLLFFSPSFTKPPIKPDVIYNGYDSNFDPKIFTPGSWGSGVYFYSKMLEEPQFEYVDATGCKEIILAEVIVGNAYDYGVQVNAALKYPPVIAGKEPKRYDSVKGSSNGTDVYVVYDKNVSYPRYIINYGTY